MNRKIIVLTVVATLIISSIAAVMLASGVFTPKNESFYIGVTFSGDNTADAKLIIDEVNDYTNLFVLQSGPLQSNRSAIVEIGDYAIDAGMKYLVYFGSDKPWLLKWWNDEYDGHWGSAFLGVYFGDEFGGKMLDTLRIFRNQAGLEQITKYAGGGVNANFGEYSVSYLLNGDLQLTNQSQSANTITRTITTYSLNQTITLMESEIDRETGIIKETRTSIVTDPSDLEYTYEELWDIRPFKNNDETAAIFINETHAFMDLYPTNATYFTSDYALYWFDYLAGYDTVLAQLGWNQTDSQVIGLVRGAANLQDKEWGTIITWKYTQAPYLASGQEVYDQMKLSYEAGAKYVVIFNYAKDMNGTFGTLQPEHFDALKRFWRDVVQNPFVRHGSARGEAAFVLPKNYGCGLRSEVDTVWGLWQPSVEYQNVWSNLQAALAKHGPKLDIVYEDPAYPVASHYPKIIYWNQTT